MLKGSSSTQEIMKEGARPSHERHFARNGSNASADRSDAITNTDQFSNGLSRTCEIF
jgi:hypothetical protein